MAGSLPSASSADRGRVSDQASRPDSSARVVERFHLKFHNALRPTGFRGRWPNLLFLISLTHPDKGCPTLRFVKSGWEMPASGCPPFAIFCVHYFY